MQPVLLAAWTISEWLALFTLAVIFMFPIIAMRRMFVKGADEKNTGEHRE